MPACERSQRHPFGIMASCNDDVIQGMQAAHQGKTIRGARS